MCNHRAILTYFCNTFTSSFSSCFKHSMKYWWWIFYVLFKYKKKSVRYSYNIILFLLIVWILLSCPLGIWGLIMLFHRIINHHRRIITLRSCSKYCPVGSIYLLGLLLVVLIISFVSSCQMFIWIFIDLHLCLLFFILLSFRIELITIIAHSHHPFLPFRCAGNGLRLLRFSREHLHRYLCLCGMGWIRWLTGYQFFYLSARTS